MTRLLLAGVCGLALLLGQTVSAFAQTQAPATQPAPATDQPSADQGTNAADLDYFVEEDVIIAGQ
ncbi:MAG: hypothetical protein E5Y34_30985, partial [Mesorhizobium sp.]